jgi:hypothetical protein
MAKKKEYKGNSVGVRFQNLVLNNRKKIMYSLATAMVVTVSLSFFIRKFYVEENTGSKQVVETTKKEPSKKLLAVKPDSKKMSAKTITSVTKVSDDLVKLIVLKNTKLKISSDNKKWINLTLKPDTYEYKFDSNVRFVFTDASAVEINYNGREMKKLGAKGEMKRVAVRKKKWLGETKKSL